MRVREAMQAVDAHDLMDIDKVHAKEGEETGSWLSFLNNLRIS